MTNYVYSNGHIYSNAQKTSVALPMFSGAADWSEYWGLETTGGSIVVYKALDSKLRSMWAKLYPVGEIVTCPDWDPGPFCGRGLHFSPSPPIAHKYRIHEPGPTRYVACSVRVKEAVVIDHSNGVVPDKIKAPRCKVLYECDERGRAL